MVVIEQFRQIAIATERPGTALRSQGIEVIESVTSTVHCLCVVRLSNLTFNGGLSPQDMIHEHGDVLLVYIYVQVSCALHAASFRPVSSPIAKDACDRCCHSLGWQLMHLHQHNF